MKFPLSANQMGIWIMAQQNPSSPVFNMQLVYHFDGAFSKDLLVRSLQSLFDTHSVLHSVFRLSGNIPVIESAPLPLALKEIDVTGSVNEKARVNEIIIEATRKPFDLENGPLYRMLLIKETANNQYFVLVVHQLVFDNYSVKIFADEVNRFFSGISADPYGTFPPAGIKVSSPVSGNTDDNSDNDGSHVAFWKENLRDCPAEIKFPFDHLRKGESSGFGSLVSLTVLEATITQLERLCVSSGCSLSDLFTAAFGLYLQKITGEDDICFGIPISNRDEHWQGNSIGQFQNTIALRLQIDRKLTFIDFLQYVKRVKTDSINHSRLSFSKVVEAINPKRISGVNPFFQVSFEWDEGRNSVLDLQSIRGSRISSNPGVSIFDFSFVAWKELQTVRIDIIYDTELLECATVQRMKEYFLSLVSQLAPGDDKPIASFSLMTQEDLRMLELVNSTRSHYPGNKTIAAVFEEQVQLNPGKPAVVFNETSLTYSELNDRANRLAWKLRESGVGRNDSVGLLTEKSLEMIVGILAILKAGGCYVPIDPEYPLQRIQFILDDSRCRWMLANVKGFDYSKLAGPEIIDLQSIMYSQPEPGKLHGINGPDDNAYIIYTSGTTGLPKGSIITQRGVVRLVKNTNYIDIKPDDRVLQSSSIVFDVSVEEIYGALLNGATLYLVGKKLLLDPDALGKYLADHRISYVDLTSALFTQIAEVRTDIFRDVKTLVVGGDVVSATHANKVRKDNPGLILLNIYGPTENSCNSTYYIIDRDFNHNIPIGRPISNSTAYIFDKDMNYLPVGIVGELYVGGDGVSKGYLNREDLNAISFVQHPFHPNERLYKTGDLARWLPDWNIDFRGRADNQLKIRGYRIELGEIEAAISEVDGIVDSVVKAIRIAEGDYRLVAFLNVSDDFNLDNQQLISLLRAKLPSFMIPSVLKFMKGFPTNINGKVDRNALVADSNDFSRPNEQVAGNSTQAERKLFEIWQEVLKTSDIRPDDNFFDIGGNSLLAISLAAKISAAFGTVVKATKVFEYPSIRDQAAGLLGDRPDPVTERMSEIEEKSRSRKNVQFKRLRN